MENFEQTIKSNRMQLEHPSYSLSSGKLVSYLA